MNNNNRGRSRSKKERKQARDAERKRLQDEHKAIKCIKGALNRPMPPRQRLPMKTAQSREPLDVIDAGQMEVVHAADEGHEAVHNLMLMKLREQNNFIARELAAKLRRGRGGQKGGRTEDGDVFGSVIDAVHEANPTSSLKRRHLEAAEKLKNTSTLTLAKRIERAERKRRQRRQQQT